MVAMIGERRSFWRKAAPPLPQTCQCGSRPPPHLSRLFTGGEAARRSVSRTAVNNERSLSSSFVQSGACVHRNNRRHPVRESRRAAFSRFPVSLFSFEIYTVGEICIRECCGQGFDKHESLWKGRESFSSEKFSLPSPISLKATCPSPRNDQTRRTRGFRRRGSRRLR